jgi:hypothetical protein
MAEKNCDLNEMRKMIEQNGEQFLATVSKLTAMTELIRQYEPDGHDEAWEVFQGIAQIIEEITDECHTFRASTMEIFQALDKNLSELFGIGGVEEQGEIGVESENEMDNSGDLS